MLPAATLAGLLVLLPADWVASRRVRTLEPAPGQPRREFLFSMSTVLIFSAVGALIIAGVQADVLRIYQDVADHGWPYLIASLAAVTAEALTDGTTEAPGD